MNAHRRVAEDAEKKGRLRLRLRLRKAKLMSLNLNLYLYLYLMRFAMENPVCSISGFIKMGICRD